MRKLFKQSELRHLRARGQSICVELAVLLLFLLTLNSANSQVSFISKNLSTQLDFYDLNSSRNFSTSQIISSKTSSCVERRLNFSLVNKILRCGDVISQPGPSVTTTTTTSGLNSVCQQKERKIANPCSACGRGVTRASRAISCDGCDVWTHIRCTPCVSVAQYNQCVASGGDIPFTCDGCCLAQLPFNGEIDVDDAAMTGTSDAGAPVTPAAQVNSSSSFLSCNIPRVLMQKGLSFVHANMRSLIPKLPEVRILLSRTKTAVFAASETWLDASVKDAEVNIPGFNVIRHDRNRNGGGVALYIRDSIAFNPRPDLVVDGLEATWVELLLPKTKGILICAIYRPPADSTFVPRLEESLSRIGIGTEFYILGDINIDFTQDNSPLFKSYKGTLDFFNCSQLIAQPTRITPTTSTVLDHVITNMGDKVKESGVVDVGFSDHLITYCVRGQTKNISHGPNVKKVRSFKNYSAEKLNEELRGTNWLDILISTDVNYCLDQFVRLFNLAVDKVAPRRELKVKQTSQPWINPLILSGIKRRDQLLRKYKKDKNNVSLYKEFCKIRNSVQRDVKLAKANFFKQKVQQNKGDSDKLWENLKSLGYSDKNVGSSSKIVLEKDGVKVFDSLKVAEMFNCFYTTVASKLVEKLPTPSGIFNVTRNVFRKLYLGKFGFGASFTLSPVSRHFVRKQLLSLNPKKAVGLDEIASRFLKDGAGSIVEPISHIVNISILTEVVPTGFKEARVVPLFKKGSKLDPGNYRPVSLLNVLSKILERAVHDQMKSYLDKNNVLYENQSGFRGKFSTDSCLIGLTDYIKGEMGKGNLVGMVLIDLQKAFDTVDHEILIEKLRSLNMSSLSWFRSYLTERQQCVEVDGVRSRFLDVTCGVPQGSILGPQLFLIYINDMRISVDCKLALYADDSALIFSHKDCGFIAERLSKELSNCKVWLIDNKLSLHVGKTECILFGTSRKLKKVENFPVTCDGVPVNRVSSVKYLGVKLDENLNGKVHADFVIKACSGRISFLYRNASCLDYFSRKILCSALIQPFIDYCTSSWYSGLTRKLKNRFDVLQRRMVRFIFFKDGRDHVDERDLLKLSWLSIPDRVDFFKLKHVFKIRNKMAPEYLMNNFKSVSLAHSYNTRGSAHNFFIPKDTSKCPTSFATTGMKLWNGLPNFLKEVKLENIFRSKLKEYFLSKY